MKILFFGDVVSKPGRHALKVGFDRLTRAHDIDFVIANVENASHGNGLLPDMAQDFLDSGIDVLTLGNHAWDQKQIIPFMSTTTRIVRALNYPDIPSEKTPGRGVTVVESRRTPGLQLAVMQVLGRVFMDQYDCPFRAAEKEAERLESLGIDCILVDFHGEATSEKQAFAHYLDGKVSAVVGTHTHVQTADERILQSGTATISDVGMCGCYDSVIGVKKELSIQRMLTKRPVKYEPAMGSGGYCAVIIDIDEKTGKSRSITRFQDRNVEL